MSYQARTKAEAVLNIKYYCRLHQLHARLYNRLRGAAAVVSVVAGSAALVSALQSVPYLLSGLGVVVAAVSGIDFFFGWAEKAACHKQWRREYSSLLARSATMDLNGIDAELAKLSGETEEEVESLRAVAWNDVLRSNGHEDGMREEGFAQRLVRSLA